MNPLRRKLAIASWDGPREPNIFGRMVLDAEPALAYVDHLRQTTGEKVTMTTVIGKAVAMALAATPSLNGYIRLGNYVEHEHVNIAFLVSFEDGKNLAKAKIDDLDKKSILDATLELKALAERLKQGKDEAFNKSMGPVKMLPTFVLKRILKIVQFLSTNLGLAIPALGVEKFPFGSCIITNVGVFGLDEGFVPPTPFAGVPLYVLIGAVKEAPWVENGVITVRRQVTITATIDHRFMDGAQGATLAKTLRKYLTNPWLFDGKEGPALLTDQGADVVPDMPTVVGAAAGPETGSAS
jgi:hypothetical protein